MDAVERDEIEHLDDSVVGLRLSVARLQVQVQALESSIKTFVTQQEFTPVKLIVYGLATAVMASVLTALMSKVLV